ncbi:MAG: Crp/Fnr family transcriptional regulator [Spirochaetaceae bacterium]|nr:Crp/Fnr family transcriptional regulator [Spirochaetaceae bacterium]
MVVFTTKVEHLSDFLKNVSGVLAGCPLFEGLSGDTVGQVLGCVKPVHRRFESGAYVFNEDDECSLLGIVLKGALHIIRDDYWGNRTIVTRLEAGMIFGEAFACAELKKLPVSVVAVERSEILLLDFKRIIKVCSNACEFHTRLIKNMVSNMAYKNVQLMEKIECISQRNTRSKILSYLSFNAKRRKSSVIEIPFNRQEMADYLSVERSALSAELCRMRDEGLLEFNKNKFRLRHAPDTILP